MWKAPCSEPGGGVWFSCKVPVMFTALVMKAIKATAFPVGHEEPARDMAFFLIGCWLLSGLSGLSFGISTSFGISMTYSCLTAVI